MNLLSIMFPLAIKSFNKKFPLKVGNIFKYLFSTNAHENIEYLSVPYNEKDHAKKKGAKWDPNAKSWYISTFQPIEDFLEWKITYLEVPFVEKDEAKNLGAKWDAEKKRWYVSGPYALDLCRKWLPKNYNKRNNKNIPIGDSVLFVDLETNGFPQREVFGYPSYQDLTAYSTSRVVQISCLLCSASDLTVARHQTMTIKSDSFPIDNHQIHGITLDQSLKLGIPFSQAIKELNPFFRQAKYFVAHNAAFDFNVLRSELHRYGLAEEQALLGSMSVYCTMHKTKNIVSSIDKTGKLKNPNLKELYKYATGKDLVNHHNAANDVANLHEAVRSLFLQGLVSFS